MSEGNGKPNDMDQLRTGKAACFRGGILCPKCKYKGTRVLRTMQVESGTRRYRACLVCDHHFTTVEQSGIGNGGKA